MWVLAGSVLPQRSEEAEPGYLQEVLEERRGTLVSSRQTMPSLARRRPTFHPSASHLYI